MIDDKNIFILLKILLSLHLKLFIFFIVDNLEIISSIIFSLGEFLVEFGDEGSRELGAEHLNSVELIKFPNIFRKIFDYFL